MQEGEDLTDFLTNRLRQLAANDKLRTLKPTGKGIDFYSNDYLGLSRNALLAQWIQEQTTSRGIVANGATGSRLLSGNFDLFSEAEHKLAEIFRAESALIFNSGYAANQGVLSSVPQRGDTIIYDELAHACIKDGARLSLAKRLGFRHNDVNDLEQKIKKASGRVFIAVESVYSMDGDISPLESLIELAEAWNATLVVDEAHSTGWLGEGGNGLICALKLHHRIPIRIYTFGKAMGVHGACVAGPKPLIEYLVNFSRPFIYTTALSPHAVLSILGAFHVLNQLPALQNQLQENIYLFRQEIGQLLPSVNATPIQTIPTPGNSHVAKIASQLIEAGLEVRPIRSPTVKEGTERIRLCLHAYNTFEEITFLADSLRRYL